MRSERCAASFLPREGPGYCVRKQLGLKEPTGSAFSALHTLPRDPACLRTVSGVLAVAIPITTAAGNSIRKKGSAVEVNNKWSVIFTVTAVQRTQGWQNFERKELHHQSRGNSMDRARESLDKAELMTRKITGGVTVVMLSL